MNFSTPNAHPFITTARRRPSKISTVSLSPPHVILSPERRTGPTMPIANYKGAEWRALFGIPNGPASSPLWRWRTWSFRSSVGPRASAPSPPSRRGSLSTQLFCWWTPASWLSLTGPRDATFRPLHAIPLLTNARANLEGLQHVWESAKTSKAVSCRQLELWWVSTEAQPPFIFLAILVHVT